MEILRKTAAFKLTQQTTSDGIVPLPIEDVTELHFTQLPLLTPTQFSPFHHLRKLSLVSLKPALKQFWDVPVYMFPMLEKLDLSDNKLTGFTASPTNGASVRGAVAADAQAAWAACTSSHKQPGSAVPIMALRRLHLVNNVIDNDEQLTALSILFPNLEVLDIAENPVAAMMSRDAVFSLWPLTLNALDAVDKDGEAIEVLETDDDEDASDEEDDEDDDEDDEEVSGDDADDDGEPAKKLARTEA
jgi:hypothetical protein